MLPPFLGALLLLATLGIVLLCAILALWARTRDNAILCRNALLTGAGVGAIYALLWVAGLLLAQRTVLAPGQAVRFCGLDCHLHVSVASVQPGTDLGVTVRFSSNAVQAPEWPGKLLFRLVDSAGSEYSPTNEIPDSALRAGESWTHELHFPAGINPAGATLFVTWKPGLDYLVPGAGNPLVQRRTRLALPAPVGSGI
jgi:hypothetical protein